MNMFDFLSALVNKTKLLVKNKKLKSKIEQQKHTIHVLRRKLYAIPKE